MRVSVIIPVYNAEKYLRDTVMSALSQPETAEVILVDDCSKDGSVAIARDLAMLDSRVVLLTQEDGKNKGSAEARNTGIKAAKYEYIAFIDSDDLMLPDRFKKTKTIFEQYPDADGVYEAVKNHFTEVAVSHSTKYTFHNLPPIHMVNEAVAPNMLLHQLIVDPVGIIMLQGLCVKKALFTKTGFFEPKFRIAQDMLLIKKMATVGKLYSGDLAEPVAWRLIHDSNISFSAFKDTIPYFMDQGEILFLWAKDRQVEKEKLGWLLFQYYTQYLYRNNANFGASSLRNKFLLKVFRQYKGVVLLKQFWALFPVVGRFVKGIELIQ